jgi:hypothetical protein
LHGTWIEGKWKLDPPKKEQRRIELPVGSNISQSVAA